MANNLFPVFEMPSAIVDPLTVNTPQYPPSPLFNVETGEFITDGTGRPLMGNGYSAWVLWCTKTILTQRWAYYGYSSNAGIEAEEAFLEPGMKAIQSSFERTITEALMADPMGRTQMVRDFIFMWNADSLFITCTVIANNGMTAVVNASLSR